ncbi:uncharacterized protein LOC144922585 [Branchiostoma floridae x Branchiostoma belcheri]
MSGTVQAENLQQTTRKEDYAYQNSAYDHTTSPADTAVQLRCVRQSVSISSLTTIGQDTPPEPSRDPPGARLYGAYVLPCVAEYVGMTLFVFVICMVSGTTWLSRLDYTSPGTRPAPGCTSPGTRPAPDCTGRTSCRAWRSMWG